MLNKQNHFAIQLFLFMMLMLGACKKDTNGDTPTPEPDPEVTASVTGRVTDEMGEPLSGATVKSGTATTTTDINGSFSFTDIKLFLRSGFVEISKAGYFSGSRTLQVNEGASNYFEIELIAKTLKGSFPAPAGGTITIENGSTVLFEPSSMENALTKVPYTGDVNVYGAYLDPEAEDFFTRMPGDLTGINVNNEETGLKSYGMLLVELETPSGEKLQITAGKKATLRSPVPPGLTASAPATIPLWYFDATKRKWVEEGSAVRQGNSYTGTVNHFSWWNYDVGIPLIPLTLKVETVGGNSLAGAYVSITANNERSASVITNENGVAKGLVPANQPLKIDIRACYNGDLIYTGNAGPFESETDLGTIRVNNDPVTFLITGGVTDCQDLPVANGNITLYLDNKVRAASITNGNFSINVNRCFVLPTQARLKVAFGNPVRFKDVFIDVATSSVNTGTLKICPNTPPTVNAGNDITITLPVNSITLSAVASDEEAPIASYLWTKLTNLPGGNIVSPSSASTQVTGLTQGTYTFNVRVTDSEGLEANDQVNVAVLPTPLANDTSTMTVNLNGTQYNLAAPTNEIRSSRSGTTTSITGKTTPLAPTAANYVQTSFSFMGAASTGSYTLNLGFLNVGGTTYRARGAINCTVTKYGTTQEYVEGNFTGTVIFSRDSANPSPPTRPLSINFRAYRTQ